MLEKLKNAGQILVGIALTLQLTGCYQGSDHHYHPWWHHDRVVYMHG